MFLSTKIWHNYNMYIYIYIYSPLRDSRPKKTAFLTVHSITRPAHVDHTQLRTTISETKDLIGGSLPTHINRAVISVRNERTAMMSPTKTPLLHRSRIEPRSAESQAQFGIRCIGTDQIFSQLLAFHFTPQSKYNFNFTLHQLKPATILAFVYQQRISPASPKIKVIEEVKLIVALNAYQSEATSIQCI